MIELCSGVVVMVLGWEIWMSMMAVNEGEEWKMITQQNSLVLLSSAELLGLLQAISNV
jgi:hypothetical protein